VQIQFGKRFTHFGTFFLKLIAQFYYFPRKCFQKNRICDGELLPKCFQHYWNFAIQG